MPVESRSVYSGPVRRSLERLEKLANGGGGGVTPPPGFSFVIDPAYAGPRKDGSNTTAQFGHRNLPGMHGLSVTSAGKIISAIRAGDWFEVQTVNAGGTGPTWVGGFGTNAYGGVIQVGDIMLGVHPAIGLNSLWLASKPAASQYILARDAGGGTLINSEGTGAVVIRNQNINWLVIDPAAASHVVQAATRFCSNFSVPTNDYWWANFYASATGGGQQARLSLSAGVAPQLRSIAVNGEKVGVVSSNAGVFVPIQASAFEVNSTIAAKRDVRPIDRRDRIVVRHDPQSDTVPEPDIMALRPVAFRPKVGATRLDPDAPDKLRADIVPEVGLLAHEGQRERLGLVAEEVETVLPSAVTHDQDGHCVGIDYAQITVALLDHVQRLTEEVATLRYRVAELEGTA